MTRRKATASVLLALFLILSLPASAAAQPWDGETNIGTGDEYTTITEYEGGALSGASAHESDEGDFVHLPELQIYDEVQYGEFHSSDSPWSGSSDRFSVIDSNGLVGDSYIRVSSVDYSTSTSSRPLSGDVRSVLMGVNQPSNADAKILSLRDGGNDVINLELDDGEIYYNDGNSATGINPPSGWYHIRISDIDWATETFDIEIIVDGTVVESYSNADFTTSASSVDGLQLTSNGGSTIYIDDIRVSAAGGGEYISDSLNAQNVEEGVVDVETWGEEVDVGWEYNDGDGWVLADSDTVSQSGSHQMDLSGFSASEWRVVVSTDGDGPVKVGEHSLRIENTAPTVEELSPRDVDVTETEPELSADITDPDFDLAHGDEVEVRFYDGDDELIGTDVATENGIATATWDGRDIGDNDWYVVAEDQYGGTTTTDIVSFNSPETLVLRDESNPDEIIDGETTVEVTFFASDEVITRTTDNGTVSLVGLPNEEMVIQAEADGYVTRQTMISSILEQQNVFLLPEDASQVTTRFTLEDPTGQFDQRSTRVFVEKPIRMDGETTYQTVAADELGSQGWTTILEQDQRYRVKIEDMGSGQTRTLGPYVASTSETVTLEVDQIEFSYEDEDIGYQWHAEYRNETDPSVLFAFESEDTIEQLTVDIYERDGTVLMSESWTNTESIYETAIIPDGIEPETTTWVVEWEAEIVLDGEVQTISGSTVVGPDQMPVDIEGVPDDVLHVVAVFLILVVGGLFSAANVGVGSVVTSLFAGLLWFIGLLPGVVSGILIGLALLISVMWMSHKARGPR